MKSKRNRCLVTLRMVDTDSELIRIFNRVNKVRNIIFDLGGVIINLDFRRTRDAFISLGAADFDGIYSQAQQSGFFDEFDKGLLSPESFRMEIRKHLPEHVTDQQIDAAWDAMLLDVPPARLELLSALKNKYRTFLLSNTNVIHVRNFSAALNAVHGTPDFTPFFERCYYSCDIRMRKPDAEIFQFVLQQHSLKAEETLFIDDSAQHIEGARKCGINAVLLQGVEVRELLAGLGL